MRHFHYVRNKYHCPTVSVDRLWTMVPDAVRKASWAKPAGSPVPVIDVTRHGFAKVLGAGILPPHPFVLKTKYVSEIAERKIKKAGGIVILTA